MRVQGFVTNQSILPVAPRSHHRRGDISRSGPHGNALHLSRTVPLPEMPINEVGLCISGNSCKSRLFFCIIRDYSSTVTCNSLIQHFVSLGFLRA